MNYHKKLVQGHFSPRNPGKYQGNCAAIVFRSSWELKFCNFCDLSEDVLNWSSECVVIPYLNPVDHRRHRYFPDFRITERTKDGIIKTIIIEIKPKSQTKPPVQKSRVTRRYITECAEYTRNQAKWDAARAYCQRRGWDFKILTEDDIKT